MNIIEFTEKYLVTFIMPSCEWSNGVELQDYEKDFLSSLMDNRLTISVASRQMHMSTLLCSYVAYKLIFGDKTKITFIDIRTDLVYERLNQIRLILDNYIKNTPTKLKFLTDNKREILFSNGSGIIGTSNSVGTFKGRYSDIVIIDNAAYIKDLNLVFNALEPTVIPNGQIHLVSAANEINYFHTMFMNAGERSPFKKNMYHYSLNSFYTPERIKESKRFIDERLWRQEMEMEFFSPIQLVRNRNLQVRVDGDTYIEVTKRLVQLNMNTSEYLYKLIKDDLDRC